MSAKMKRRKASSRPSHDARTTKPVLALGPMASWLPDTIVATAAASIVAYVLIGYCGLVPLIVAPVLAGTVAALIARDVTPAALAGGLGGLVGGIGASRDYVFDALVKHLDTAPEYVFPNVLAGPVYRDFLTPLVQANPARSGGVTVVIVTCALSLAVSTLVALGLALSRKRALVESIASWAVVAALVIVFVSTSWSFGATFRASLATDLADGTYGHDASLYRRAYQEMGSGTGYYQALVRAGEGDKRLISENAVREGKFYTFISSPTLAREPWAFYLWQAIAPGRPQNVFLFGLLLCGAALAAVHWGLREASLPASLVAPVLLFPVLMLMSIWENIFFPDYWAGIVAIMSAAFLFRDRLLAAAGLALVAALFRETLIFWLIAIVILATLRSRASAHGRRDLAIVCGLFAAFVGLYALHYHDAAQIIAASANGGIGGFFTRLALSSATSFDTKFLAPFAYLMWPLGHFRFPAAAYGLLGLAGYALSFEERPALRWVLSGYAVVWLLYYATIGAASSYWGQQVLPFYLVGVALLLGWIARTFGAGRSSRGAKA